MWIAPRSPTGCTHTDRVRGRRAQINWTRLADKDMESPLYSLAQSEVAKQADNTGEEWARELTDTPYDNEDDTWWGGYVQ